LGAQNTFVFYLTPAELISGRLVTMFSDVVGEENASVTAGWLWPSIDLASLVWYLPLWTTLVLDDKTDTLV
jgi:hypothetical protein